MNTKAETTEMKEARKSLEEYIDNHFDSSKYEVEMNKYPPMKEDNIRDRLLMGVNTLCDTVKCTLGAKGRTVLYNKKRDFEDEIGYPVTTKDGVTVAKQVKSKNVYENMAIQIVRESAQKTVDSSGDGTTTTVILAQKLINAGFRLIDDGHSIWEISEHFDKAVYQIVSEIRRRSIPVEDNYEYLRKVAAVSANSTEVGELMEAIVEEIGVYGDIEVKRSQLGFTEVELVKGMKLHKGYMEPFMCTDFDRMVWEGTDVKVLVFDDTIRDLNDILPYLKYSVSPNGSVLPILIYAKDVADTALERIKQWMVVNRRALVIVEHDGFGDRTVELMNDLSILTGATIVDSDVDAEPSFLGFCKEAQVDRNYTSILFGGGNEEEINNHASSIERKLKNADKADLKYFRKRLANLRGGIAVINVGGTTKVQMEEEYARMEDAALAIKSAMKEGVSIGGAYTWEHVSKSNDKRKPKNHPAYNLVYDSLREILHTLCVNAGIEDREFEIRNTIRTKRRPYDIKTDSFYGRKKYPILDATSVLVDSITNAIAVAKSVLGIDKAIYNGEVLN